MSLEIHALSDALSVTAQITVDDLPEIAAKGYKTIICHRPDGEASAQPAFETIADACGVFGIQAIHQPVVSGQISLSDGLAFRQHLAAAPSPVLAYCRSGSRSTQLANMALGV
jgi:sulfide:quinone oxidoreductase